MYLKRYKMVTFGRHPFVLLVSTYKDKLIDGNTRKMMNYSEVPNTRADLNKRAGLEKSATLLAYLLSKLINEQG